MGVIGDKNRLDAATISDAVNTASREGLTKYFGTPEGVMMMDKK